MSLDLRGPESRIPAHLGVTHRRCPYMATPPLGARIFMPDASLLQGNCRLYIFYGLRLLPAYNRVQSSHSQPLACFY